jgi:hypothetical protein
MSLSRWRLRFARPAVFMRWELKRPITMGRSDDSGLRC